MAVLLNAVSTNTDQASATGTATETSTRQLIEIPGDSVFNGAEVVIQMSSVNTAAKFSATDRIASMTAPGNIIIECPIGHYVRAINNKSATGTSITVNMLPV